MSISRLINVVPPPVEACQVFDGDWSDIEFQLGLELPRDYRDFIKFYGLGEFMKFIWIHPPYSDNTDACIVRQAREIYRAYGRLRGFACRLWPYSNGLLPFGHTMHGDTLFWSTIGPPDQWRVVVHSWADWTLEYLDCGLTDFLAGLSLGECRPESFPSDMLPCDIFFDALQLPPRDASDEPAPQRRRQRAAGGHPAYGPIHGRFAFVWRPGF